MRRTFARGACTSPDGRWPGADTTPAPCRPCSRWHASTSRPTTTPPGTPSASPPPPRTRPATPTASTASRTCWRRCLRQRRSKPRRRAPGRWPSRGHNLEAEALVRNIRQTVSTETGLHHAGAAAWLRDQTADAIRLLDAARNGSADPAIRAASGGSLAALGWAYFDAGRWDDALELIAETGNDPAGDVTPAAGILITATIEAARGNTAHARELVLTALAADPEQSRAITARARHALGLCALADDDYLTAFEQLRQLFGPDGTPYHPHVSYLAAGDLALAAARADCGQEGREIVKQIAELHATAASWPSARLRQLLTRADCVLADPSTPDAYPDDVLSDPAGEQWPFERAQLRLEYGQWLRRHRRINHAKQVLSAAHDTFGALASRPWAHRAATELRACGIAVPGAVASAAGLGALTPQQREIIELAAQGLTNREIGLRLHLSPRTVASHLHRSFPKLGIAGRLQLHAVITPADRQARTYAAARERTSLPAPRSWRSGQTASDKPRQVHRIDPELLEDVTKMRIDSVRGDEELVGDLLVGAPMRGKVDDHGLGFASEHPSQSSAGRLWTERRRTPSRRSRPLHARGVPARPDARRNRQRLIERCDRRRVVAALGQHSAEVFQRGRVGKRARSAPVERDRALEILGRVAPDAPGMRGRGGARRDIRVEARASFGQRDRVDRRAPRRPPPPRCARVRRRRRPRAGKAGTSTAALRARRRTATRAPASGRPATGREARGTTAPWCRTHGRPRLQHDLRDLGHLQRAGLVGGVDFQQAERYDRRRVQGSGDEMGLGPAEPALKRDRRLGELPHLQHLPAAGRLEDAQRPVLPVTLGGDHPGVDRGSASSYRSLAARIHDRSMCARRACASPRPPSSRRSAVRRISSERPKSSSW